MASCARAALFAFLLLCGAATEARADGTATDVIVIGAGWAGISAARRLSESSPPRRVLLLEMRDGVGGRSRTLTPFGNPLDMGSSWIHGTENNPITALAKKYNATTIPWGNPSPLNGNYFAADGKRITSLALDRLLADAGVLYAEMETLNETMMSGPLDRALDATFDRYGWGAAKRQQLRALLEATFDVGNAADLDQVSMKEGGEGGCGEMNGGWVVFPDGYGALARRVALDLPQSVTLRLNAHVTAVSQDAGGVTVRTADGLEFTAAHVINTVPLGVLQRGSIAFDPPLSATTQLSVDKAGWGVVDKVWLEFPEGATLPWSKLHKDSTSPVNIFYLPEVPRYNFFLDWHALTGLPQMLVFCSGKCALRQANISDADVLRDAMANLRTMFPDAPEPVRVHCTRWHTDPSSYGSYSFGNIGETAADRKELLKPSGRIWFAGEAIWGGGYTHGAWASGLSAADAVLNDVPADSAVDFRDKIVRSICGSGQAPRSKFKFGHA